MVADSCPGFSTASGKAVQVDGTVLNKRRRIFEDLNLEWACEGKRLDRVPEPESTDGEFRK